MRTCPGPDPLLRNSPASNSQSSSPPQLTGSWSEEINSCGTVTMLEWKCYNDKELP